MQIEIVDGHPVLVSQRDRHHRITKYRKPQKATKSIRGKMGKIGHDEQVALTIRQRQALKNWLGGEMTKTEAAKAAGYSSPAVINRALEKLSKNEAFIRKMEDKDLTDDFIIDKIKEGCDAQHPLANPGEDGKRPKDYHAIDKFVDKYIKIKGLYAPTKIQQETEAKHIHIHMTTDDAKAMQEYKRMREEAGEVS